MVYVSDKLKRAGYFPIIVPEAATILINAGITPSIVSPRAFQENVIDLMVALERAAEAAAIASGHPRPVILCDRGIMGARGYVSDKLFFNIAKKKGLNLGMMSDARYAGVFHLRTAAFDAEHAYTCANNSARSETPKEARARDERTLRAWVGHPHVRIIHNRVGSFEEKQHALWKHVCLALGIPEPLEIERKFLIKPLRLPLPGVLQQKVVITQAYAKEKGIPGLIRVRKRVHRGDPTYFATRKKKLSDTVYREDERLIDVATYEKLLARKVGGTGMIQKDRHCFVYRDQYFELDVFKGAHKGLFLLEIELLEEGSPVELPPFLRIIREVTNDPAYKNGTLAKSA